MRLPLDGLYNRIFQRRPSEDSREPIGSIVDTQRVEGFAIVALGLIGFGVYRALELLVSRMRPCRQGHEHGPESEEQTSND